MPLSLRADRALVALTLAGSVIAAGTSAQQSLPSGPLVIRAFTLRFDPAGTFTLSGDGWPSMAGTWTTSGREVTLLTGKEIYRQRLPLVGSGYSASPVAADGKIYVSNEDGEMLVIEAGPTFRHIATNSIGESLMATPALSQGVMYVRGARTLFAIAKK